MLRQHLLVVLISLLVVSCNPSDTKTVSGNKITIRLIGEVEDGMFIQFDDIRITHELLDTANTELTKLDCINISKRDEKHYILAPSKAYLATPKRWLGCTNPTGAIVNGWIRIFAFLNRDGINFYTLDMEHYLAYEGYFIIKRKDGKNMSVTYSNNFPITVSVTD